MEAKVVIGVVVIMVVIVIAAFLYIGSYTQKQGSPPATDATTSIAASSSVSITSTVMTSNSTAQHVAAPSNFSEINASLSPNAITAGWYGSVETEVAGGYLIVTTNDIPPVSGNFPNKYDPNKIEPQNFTFKIPLHPNDGSHTVPTPTGGQIGIALNGVVFFGPLDANGNDAVKNEGISFDQCNGHPQQGGVYHYHEFSPCIANSIPGQHSPLIGFAFDGYPIYGPDGANGIPIPQNALDACNGHYDPQVGSYVYVATANFPYLLGCYTGSPVTSDFSTGPG